MSLKSLEKILFLKIETVPQYETFNEAPEELQKLFTQRYKEDILKVGSYQEVWNEKCSLQAEFGKIVCVSVGLLHNGKFVKKHFSSENEAELLAEFVGGKLSEKLNDISGGVVFCSYTGTSFDFPFLAKRLIMNGLMVPKFLFYTERKPWERTFIIDFKDTWKWEIYNGNVSLKLLSYSLGLGSGDEISGDMIKDLYYKEKDLESIARHCDSDTELLYQCYKKLLINFANA